MQRPTELQFQPCQSTVDADSMRGSNELPSPSCQVATASSSFQRNSELPALTPRQTATVQSDQTAYVRFSSTHVRRPAFPTREPSLRDTFTCLHPVNPHMRSSEARLQTFLDNSSIWPAHRIRATPQQIVDAGMYYLGERDRVKCWYCNGGLQNWERDDDPMEEHAKWFPLCEFVLQQKGPDYVHEIVARFPGLRRPQLINPASGASTSRSSSSQSTPIIVDPQKEQEEAARRASEDMQSSPLATNAQLMGFSNTLIQNVLKR